MDTILRYKEIHDFENYFRMSNDNFKIILELVTPFLLKKDTVMREAISAREKLAITLHYIAIGAYFKNDRFSAIMFRHSISQTVQDTCEALIYVLKDYIKVARQVYFYLHNSLLTQRKFYFVEEMSEFEISNNIERILCNYIGLNCVEYKTNKICLQGPVKIKNIWFYIKLVYPNFPKTTDFQLQVQESLNIRTYTSDKLNSNKDYSTIEELLENLPALIDISSNYFRFQQPQQDVACKNIYAEVAKLYSPLEHEICVNDDCSLIEFTKFSQNEQHFLKVALPSLQLLDHSLPSCIDWNEMLGKSTNLSTLLHKYKTYLEDMKEFYENFSNIDELCYVVHPSLPNTKANWRLFVLKDRVFLKLQIADPFSPLSSMSVKIIGPTPEVSQLRRVYSEGLRDWDSELDVHKNLLRIFDLCFFPMPPTESSQATLQFCNICYCYKLENNEIPVVSCDNNQCSLIFHYSCLREWFSTLTDGKIFLDVAFGACPFCKAKLSTSFQEILA